MKRKKSTILIKVCLTLFLIGSCTLPGCEVVEEFVCPCLDQDYPAYYPGGGKCYKTTTDCEIDNPGKICRECGI